MHLLKSTLFKSNFIFTAKLRRYRDFPSSPSPHTHCLPCFQHPPEWCLCYNCSVMVPLCRLQWHIMITKVHRLSFMVLYVLWVWTNFQRHASDIIILYNIFSLPPNSSGPCLVISLAPTLGNPWSSFYCLHSFAFSRMSYSIYSLSILASFI